MTRELNRLTARKIAALATPGRHADGGGLYLVIDDAGSKRWVFLYRLNGKRREMGLGGLSKVPLATAREKAEAARHAVGRGLDPIEAANGKAAPPAIPTFAECAASYMRDHQASWRNPKHRAQWQQTLDDYCGPINQLPVDKVTTAGVLDCLRPIWSEKPETASRVRGRIERILDAARAAGHREGDNPARWRGHLAVTLPKPRKLIRGHHAAMPYPDVPAFVAKLRERDAIAARMLELVILTAARSGEVRAMRRAEIDVRGMIWTVPAERMKAKRPHRVPLVPRALNLMGDLDALAPGDLVFPASHGRPYSDMVFTALLRRMKVQGCTTHGFRSSFKDWGEDETAHGREVIEAALAHVIGDKAERAYRRSDALEKRRRLLHDWAAFLDGKAGRLST